MATSRTLERFAWREDHQPVSGTALSDTLWIERVPGLDGWDLWAVCEGGRETLKAPSFVHVRAAAERHMTGRPEVAWYTEPAPTPVTFLSGRVADLIGLSPQMHQTLCARSQFQEWMAAATRKGLVHHVVQPDEHVGGGTRGAISVGIDAAWLGGGESGAQVAATEMVRELARRPEIECVTLISESGGVPAGLQGIAKVSGAAWSALLAGDTPAVDIMHRPYQPGTDVDYRRYHRVARCVAVTVLDFIAYDNPNYHESEWAWRQYQQVFDENVCLADCVFAISRSVGTRLEHQFAHQLAGPVRPVLLGTNHLHTVAAASAPAELGPAVGALENGRFLLVLGNDFEHKNRDFAVKVFADMRDRGYDGQLVLAGFHLDRGSSFGHELLGASGYTAQVIRLGSVSSAEKAWLLQTAQAVLYPTSAEGFGLVPFEAAALGTPTAFVRFGPLAETLPDVDACAAWQVRAFADHVFRLLADPDIASRADSSRSGSAHLVGACGSDSVGLSAPVEPRRPVAHSRPAPARHGARGCSGRRMCLAYRARNKLRRLAGKTS